MITYGPWRRVNVICVKCGRQSIESRPAYTSDVVIKGLEKMEYRCLCGCPIVYSGWGQYEKWKEVSK